MTTFKKGDKVKVTDVMRSDRENGMRLGQILTVTIDQEDESDDVFVNFNGDYEYSIACDQIEYVERGRRASQKPIKFLLKYDLDEDPIEEFSTLPEVKKRIAELIAEEEDLQKDSIVVYELKRKINVKLSTKVTFSTEGVKRGRKPKNK